MLASLILALAAGAATVPADGAGTPVLASAIERGQVLSVRDFTQADLPANAARGALLPRQAAGQEAARNLRAGTPVRAGDVVAPRLVHRGEAVTIRAVSGTLTISSAGRALDDAGRGEPVRVLNLATNRTLDAVAEAPGQVSIAIP